MGRIFWHSFLTIWLTMAGAIGMIAAANAYLQILPPKDGFIDTREMFTFEVLGGYLRQDDSAGARTFIAQMSRLTPTISASTTALPDPKAAECVEAERRRVALTRPAHWPFQPVGGLDGGATHPASVNPDRNGVVTAFALSPTRCYRIDIRKQRLSFYERYAPAVLPVSAALLASLISSFLLASYLVSPIMKLREGLNTLARGVFSVRIGAALGRRRDEIASLGKDFDATAAKLEELDAAQKRLFHDVSHELRSPLSRLQAAVGLLKKNAGKLDSLLPRMEREIQRQDGLVEEILTLARLGPVSGPTLERERIDVMDLLTAVVDDAAFEAQPKDVTVELSGPEGFVTAVNGELIYRAIENVVRNAVKYSTSGSRISVHAVIETEDALTVRINNIGVSVEEADLEKIFHPFTRLSENEAGYGLGLAITRRAVEAHGGAVAARANAGGGLTVTLSIPRLD